MDEHSIHSKIAYLESKLDHYESELCYLNELLIRCGFCEGISTLKSTAEELLLQEMGAGSFE